MALINKLEAIGDAIREKTGKSDLLTLDQMVTEIGSIETGGGGYYPPAEALNLTDNCDTLFQNGKWAWFIRDFGDKITTSEITSMKNMFTDDSVQGKYSTLEEVPFDIYPTTTKDVNAQNMFKGNRYLKTLPEIYNLKSSTLDGFMNTCEMVKEIPESFLTWDFSALHNSTSGNVSSFFSYCKSLRTIPTEFLKQLWVNNTSYYYHIYRGMNDLNVLDEIVGLPISPAVMNGGALAGIGKNCYRLKNLIFETNEDGSAKVALWKLNNMDLSTCMGHGKEFTWSAPYRNITNYGITEDKAVYDDASYQALKNDPDWFTIDVNYSRYNHDSAVATINSLPDVTTNGSGSTITFLGQSGALTDGGAINTLTEEEIAVAAAKGWTIAFK